MEFREKYTATRIINSGAYGVIYEIQAFPPCVVKVLNEDYTDPGDRQRMIREIRCLNQLAGNPNVVKMLDYDENAELPWYVMYRANYDLEEYVSRNTKLSDAEILAVARSILQAMEAAHALDILHRDLGPRNILIFEGDPYPYKVADFSLGRDFKKDTKQLTRTSHARLGHDAFIAPEQYESLSAASKLSDIYSIGALILFMCTGKNPLRTTRTDRVFGSIVRELMQHDPARRPQNIGSVAKNIDQIERISSMPQQTLVSFDEVIKAFFDQRKFPENHLADLTRYLTRENRLYTGGRQGNFTYDEYFSPLLQAPPQLIMEWASTYAEPANVDVFLDRFREQLELLTTQTNWTFRDMTGICEFLLRLFHIDDLKSRLLDMLIYVYIHGFGEANGSLKQVVTGRYEQRQIIDIAMVLGNYSDENKMIHFMAENSGQIKHMAFIEQFP